MYTIGKLQHENELSDNSFTTLEKSLLTCLEIVIFFEVFVYNFTALFLNKSKNILDAATSLHQTTKQKIAEHKTTVFVLGKKMQL